MHKLVITRNVGPDAMSVLAESGLEIIANPNDAPAPREWVLSHLRDPQVHAICIMHSQKEDKVDDEFLEACNENLKVISTFSVGYDHIDVAGANAKGIKVGHTPGVLSDSVADICVMLVLMAMRRVEEGIQLIKSGGWPQLPWAPFVMCGPAIHAPGLTIGFLGFGRISEETLRRLLVFTNRDVPPKVVYLSSRARENQAEIDANFSKQFGVEVKRAEKEQVAEQSDVLIVLCNQTKDTVGMVDRAFLKRMKPTSVLVNGARGPIVVTDDLADALDAGEIFSAGLDVITGEPNVGPDNRLVQHKKCAVIPHMGSGDWDTRKKMADLCVRNAINGALGKPLVAEVKL